MNKYLIYIRSNTFSKLNIDKAKRMLDYSFPNIEFTNPIISVPSNKTELPFRNILGSFKSESPVGAIIETLRSIEYSITLKPRHKVNNKILIQIELIKHGETTPNKDLTNNNTVQTLLKNINY